MQQVSQYLHQTGDYLHFQAKRRNRGSLCFHWFLPRRRSHPSVRRIREADAWGGRVASWCNAPDVINRPQIQITRNRSTVSPTWNKNRVKGQTLDVQTIPLMRRAAEPNHRPSAGIMGWMDADASQTGQTSGVGMNQVHSGNVSRVFVSQMFCVYTATIWKRWPFPWRRQNQVVSRLILQPFWNISVNFKSSAV